MKFTFDKAQFTCSWLEVCFNIEYVQKIKFSLFSVVLHISVKNIYLIPTNSSPVVVCSFGTFSVSDYRPKLLHICKPKMCQHY